MLVDAKKYAQRVAEGGDLRAIIDECSLLTSSDNKPLLGAGTENVDDGSPKVLLKFPQGLCHVTMGYA
jgi:hypothetical protein